MTNTNTTEQPGPGDGGQLEACPFCDNKHNKEAEKESERGIRLSMTQKVSGMQDGEVSTSQYYFYYCDACLMEGPLAETEAEARALWNNRPAPSVEGMDEGLLQSVAKMLEITKTFDGYDEYPRVVPEGFTEARESLEKSVNNCPVPVSDAVQVDADMAPRHCPDCANASLTLHDAGSYSFLECGEGHRFDTLPPLWVVLGRSQSWAGILDQSHRLLDAAGIDRRGNTDEQEEERDLSLPERIEFMIDESKELNRIFGPGMDALRTELTALRTQLNIAIELLKTVPVIHSRCGDECSGCHWRSRLEAFLLTALTTPAPAVITEQFVDGKLPESTNATNSHCKLCGGRKFVEDRRPDSCVINYVDCPVCSVTEPPATDPLTARAMERIAEWKAQGNILVHCEPGSVRPHAKREHLLIKCKFCQPIDSPTALDAVKKAIEVEESNGN